MVELLALAGSGELDPSSVGGGSPGTVVEPGTVVDDDPGTEVLVVVDGPGKVVVVVGRGDVVDVVGKAVVLVVDVVDVVVLITCIAERRAE